tara:strand:- start:37660 stop:40095 length:2436 start_codon:yes stop_codon:yes gene_type:complete
MATKAQLEQDLIKAVAKIRVSNQGAPMDVKFSDGKTYTVYNDGSGAGDALGINFRGMSDQFNSAESALRPAPTPIQQPQEQPRQQEQQQQAAPLSQPSSSSSNGQFPTLNQSIIDKNFRYGKDRSNEITSFNSDIRDGIYNAGWDQKSDAVRVLTGAGNYGIVANIAGMGGSEFKTAAGYTASDKDFIAAAQAAGIDNPSQYQRPAGGGLGSIGAKVLDQGKIYNLLQEKGKDLYTVTNAVEGAKRGELAKHATVLYKADGSGNLAPVTNDQGQPQAQYFNATRYAKAPSFFEEYGPFLALLPAVGGILQHAGVLGSLGTASGTAGLTAGEVAANTGISYFPGVEAGAGHIMAGYTGAPLNALGVSAGLGGAGYFGADTMDNIIANAIADTYNPNAPKYEVGPEGPAKIGTQQFPQNPKIGSTSILDDIKNGYKAYKTATQVGGAVNQILGNNPDQGLGGIDPATGIAGALSSLAAGKQLGALPNEGQGTFLQGAPVGENAALQPMQLQQLSPELGAVDPQLLSQLLNKNKPAMGGQQGMSHYTYGAMPAMQDTTYTGGAGALLSGKPASQYDALGSAGLRQISGYKKGGEVMSPDLLDILEEWGAEQDLKTQTRDQIDNLSPVDLETLRLAFRLDKHDKYKTGKFPSGQDSVINPTRFYDQPIEDMPGDFKYNRLETDIGNIIRDNPYKPNEMDSMTKDWDGLGTQRQEAMRKRYYAKGGETHVPEFITGKTGFYVEGAGDGQSDSIPAMLADGEYVFDADTVAALGNGSNKAGAAMLDKMRQRIRKHKRSASHKNIPPKAKSPLEYLKG